MPPMVQMVGPMVGRRQSRLHRGAPYTPPAHEPRTRTNDSSAAARGRRRDARSHAARDGVDRRGRAGPRADVAARRRAGPHCRAGPRGRAVRRPVSAPPSSGTQESLSPATGWDLRELLADTSLPPGWASGCWPWVATWCCPGSCPASTSSARCSCWRGCRAAGAASSAGCGCMGAVRGSAAHRRRARAVPSGTSCPGRRMA